MKQPELYKYLHSRMENKIDGLGREITNRKAKSIIINFRIPKNLMNKVLNEMEDYSLIKKVNKRRFKINVMSKLHEFKE